MYQIRRLPRPRARLKQTAFCTLSRRFSSAIAEAIARARSSSSGLDLDAGSSTGSAIRLRQRARGEAHPGHAELARRSPRRAARARTTRPSRPCSRAPCRRGAIRAGHALRAIASPTASRPPLDELGHAGLWPEARRARTRIWLPSGSSFDLHDLRGLDRQRRHVRRGDHRLPHARDALREHLPAAGIELREDVVEQEQGRRRAAALLPRAGARAPRGAARPVSRTGADRGRRSRSATSSRCGPSPVVPRSRSRASRCSSASRVGGCGVVPEARRAAARARRLVRANAGRALRASRGAGRRASAPSAATCSVHGSSASRSGEAELHAAQRRVPLRERGEIVLRHRRARREEARERPVEVRAARGGPALHDGEAVRGEDERRDLAAERLGGRQLRAVHACLLRLALAQGHRRARAARRSACLRRRTRAAVSPKRISCASWRVRGEKPCVTTCSDSSRFVLPTPLRPTTSTIPGSSARSSDAYERYWRS